MSKGALRNTKYVRTRDTSESFACRDLLARLLGMGTAFALFGRYMSTRIDVLPRALCETMAEIPDSAMPMRLETMREMFTREIGCAPECAFQEFEPHPFESRRLWQAYHATLAGSQVVVRIMRLDAQALANEADFSATIFRLMEPHEVTDRHIKDMIKDFRRELSSCQTFQADLESSSLFEQDAQGFDVLGVPRPIEHLCAPHVAVYELSPTITAIPNPELARTLCFAWLHQALRGRVYPVDPRIENIALSSEGRVVFGIGPFGRLSQRVKSNLLNYLVAVASENTDEAYTYLSQAYAAIGSSCVDEDLCRTFHQAVAFRDSSGKGASSYRPAFGHRIADEVLMHWRFISERGWIEPTLTPFYRGLFTMVDTAQRINSDHDLLAEALYDLRLAVLFGQAREMMQPSEITGFIESYASAAMTLPQQIDRLLDKANLPAGNSQSKNSRTALFSLLVALWAMAMLFQRIVNVPTNWASSDRLVFWGFIAIGVLVLSIGNKLT